MTSPNKNTPRESRDPELTKTPLAEANAAPSATGEDLGELPDSYGTQQLYLTARDPHWLFAYWDLTAEQYDEHTAKADDAKLYLLVIDDNDELTQQIHIGRETRNWYVHVGQGNARFRAELAIKVSERYETLAKSGQVATPPENLARHQTAADFATLPMQYTFDQLYSIARSHMQPGEDLAETIARLQEENFDFPYAIENNPVLNDEQHVALMHYLEEDFSKRRVAGSEFGSGEWVSSFGSGAWTTSMGSGFVSSLSSPFGGVERGFFMHVNAELIIYGGTDPNAKVLIDGKQIALREDGTFSYHFVLPDGKFKIPVVATSPDGVETRAATLDFSRGTEKVGDVANTGQPPLNEPMGRQ